MPNISRRSTLGALSALAFSGAGFAAPSYKPVRIIVPWNAGAAADLLARALANSMTQIGGQPVVVDNRSGANGGIGSLAVAKAPTDGTTLLVSNADTHAINPFVFRKLAYDPVKNFEPVSLFSRVPFALVSGPSRPEITSLASFIATAKANQGKLTFASWGVGSTSHIGMELIMRQVGIQMHHVPYPGQAPGLMALQGGHVDMMLVTAGGADAAAKGGSVRVLGVAADKRLDLMATTPTLKELGVNIATGNWFAFHAPQGTPADTVAHLAQLTSTAMKDPRVLETFRLQAAIPEDSGPEKLGEFVLAEQKRWGAVVREANIVID